MTGATSERPKSKINYETVAEMSSGLIIVKVLSESIREQDVNARIMKTEMQKQLTDNIKKRGQLESLPFCALTLGGTRIEIISGHHRIRSGKDAGLKEIFVILDTSGLNRSKITAKQIVHNAISGFDDRSTLRELAKYQEFADVKNVGATIHAMTKAALHEMGAETAEIIDKAVSKMIDSGLIDSKNKSEFLRILAERYLEDEK